MVVFNLVAVLELLVAMGLYWLISLAAPGLESPGDIALGDTTTSSLVLCTAFFAVTAASELLGGRGRLFWLPTHAFVGLWLGVQLSERIGAAGWAVAGVLAAAVLGVSWWRNRGDDAVSEAEAQRALLAVDDAVSRSDLNDAWTQLQRALITGDRLTASAAQHNRRVLTHVAQLTPPVHQAFVASQVGPLDEAYARIAAGASPGDIDLTGVLVIRAIIEQRGNVPQQAYAVATRA